MYYMLYFYIVPSREQGEVLQGRCVFAEFEEGFATGLRARLPGASVRGERGGGGDVGVGGGAGGIIPFLRPGQRSPSSDRLVTPRVFHQLPNQRLYDRLVWRHSFMVSSDGLESDTTAIPHGLTDRACVPRPHLKRA